ncbi:hypothetical protein ACL9RL_10905 [Plantibacter sp. Mn2098]|uniref:hypothetical protein n=1 Tax=Plantibacter sp. Mn2098 TaxID=3395266 RepID=UPI003BDFC4E9
MGFLDRLLGRNLTPPPASPRSADELAVERYERLLRTAPTDTIQQAHVEAFERLTPEQLAILFDRFTEHADAAELAGKPAVRPPDARPESLATAATDAEATEPGALKRLFGYGFGVPAAAVLGGAMFVVLAGYVIASHPASGFMAGDDGGSDGETDHDGTAGGHDGMTGGDHGSASDPGIGDPGFDFGADVTGFDFDF